MLDLWEEQGPPVHIAAAAYLGLIGKKKKKRPGSGMPPRPFDNKNPFAIHDKPAPQHSEGGDLNDLVKMFAGTGGMIM